MAGGKEIRTQISSIKNTQKITSAMEMVAASKMKKAQDRMLASRPYSEKIAEVIGHLAYAHSEFEHPYMKEIGDVKCVGIIIISSDRGLCGGLNTNLFRSLLKTIVDYQAQGIDVELCTIGKKATSFFKNTDLNIKSVLTDLGDAPQFDDLLGTVKVMLDAYDAGEVQQLSVAYNKFENTMTQVPTVSQLVPMVAGEVTGMDYHWDYIYEPDAQEALGALLVRYIEALVYQGLVENIACEQSSRMIAMKSATDNAGDMVKDLELVYNKARQAAITQEISEIVSGAAAV
ncbi:F0F1 ATP synthase subunit gamma [bacterium endosymbiont of Bathymodiolus sp. 5 South]|jgi:F-type H+-transporting ATPase subunit gamma|uniref:F0F1 ATP synthase subunit gamma n=2 Tax=bacterium endosymbiont of Bathymodiolus sp. 5 South TaxID=1181670 RepID=UPI0010B9E190|nr:F0F1 ATP synthase subunit gamma [bacterium endosymbiont of Bathymodiolus sp. 5 South]SHN91588.1 ATP synthase gamma chain [bacterium endosymbiont of Bathymodiolus sp. 5 South]VVH61631.1 ATP synthase gamma chain (EC [uncultured Gammaproteobacteria bacterium]VVM20416.1 ATP synthase gamma chain (EC [uncultured Gammaproteobacteria bacterium]VVM24216.1 ATP synthase gamma chain (EC [uncultured Gammaproteobacteria bacterium]